MKTDGLGRAGNLSEAVSMAERADVVILVLGLSAEIEGEQGDAGNSEASGDKADLRLTGLQNVLLQTIVAVGKPTVLVLVSGSPLDLGWADANVGAIVQAFYPGQEGGRAIADVLFGDTSPAGRLPVTFPRSVADLPPIADYRMRGRTYRYLEREPLYPFGFGLSYTRFRYSDLEVTPARGNAGEPVDVAVTVTNMGQRRGDEVVQLYVKDLESSCRVPNHDLRGFKRVALGAGESRRVRFRLSARDLSLIDERGRRMLEPGKFRLFVGGSQPDGRSVRLAGTAPLAAEFELQGQTLELPY
jgi:beta-glucosidase